MSRSSSASDPISAVAEPFLASRLSDQLRAGILLPDRLDFAAARDLHADLIDLRGAEVTIDGRAVSYTGALAVQVLVAAAREWKSAGRSICLTISQDMNDDLLRLGALKELQQLIEVVKC